MNYDDEYYWMMIESLAAYGYCAGSSEIVLDLEAQGFARRTYPEISSEYAELTDIGRNHFAAIGKPVPQRTK